MLESESEAGELFSIRQVRGPGDAYLFAPSVDSESEAASDSESESRVTGTAARPGSPLGCHWHCRPDGQPTGTITVLARVP